MSHDKKTTAEMEAPSEKPLVRTHQANLQQPQSASPKFAPPPPKSFDSEEGRGAWFEKVLEDMKKNTPEVNAATARKYGPQIVGEGIPYDTDADIDHEHHLNNHNNILKDWVPRKLCTLPQFPLFTILPTKDWVLYADKRIPARNGCSEYLGRVGMGSGHTPGSPTDGCEHDPTGAAVDGRDRPPHAQNELLAPLCWLCWVRPESNTNTGAWLQDQGSRVVMAVETHYVSWTLLEASGS
ncbi:uncharacterized protein GIQ15_02400 [Arthroderma uncinatum]|uniref:uncharacterized protein n=1 Tax=Arthroderma uncinatum TaxID=74035 RepID=UPI00144AE2C4|nr:uncharacterized protein GIQ15_02400 [Arthroderma uncinatum]KAF3483076.1 hypothetical protein GIQ15_02400 [Arthroderma uncinatum]